MNILKKYKNNKKYNKLTFISIFLVALFSLSTITNILTSSKISLDLEVIEVKLKLTEEYIAIDEKTLKEYPNLSFKEIFVDYSEKIKTKNELTEEIKSKKEE